MFYPLEIVKTRSQIEGELTSNKIKYTYNLTNIGRIMKAEGFKGMYRGYSISIICIPVFNTIYFPIYSEFKKFV